MILRLSSAGRYGWPLEEGGTGQQSDIGVKSTLHTEEKAERRRRDGKVIREYDGGTL